jgi:hypothetical protein
MQISQCRRQRRRWRWRRLDFLRSVCHDAFAALAAAWRARQPRRRVAQGGEPLRKHNKDDDDVGVEIEIEIENRRQTQAETVLVIVVIVVIIVVVVNIGE